MTLTARRIILEKHPLRYHRQHYIQAIFGEVENIQYTSSEYSRYSHLSSRGHLQSPNANDGKDEHHEVRKDINSSRHENRDVDVDAMTWSVWVPNPRSRDALEYLQEEVRQIKRQIKPDEQVDDSVRVVLAGRRKHSQIQEEEGQFCDKYQRRIHDLRRIRQLRSKGSC